MTNSEKRVRHYKANRHSRWPLPGSAANDLSARKARQAGQERRELGIGLCEAIDDGQVELRARSIFGQHWGRWYRGYQHGGPAAAAQAAWCLLQLQRWQQRYAGWRCVQPAGPIVEHVSCVSECRCVFNPRVHSGRPGWRIGPARAIAAAAAPPPPAQPQSGMMLEGGAQGGRVSMPADSMIVLCVTLAYKRQVSPTKRTAPAHLCCRGRVEFADKLHFKVVLGDLWAQRNKDDILTDVSGRPSAAL